MGRSQTLFVFSVGVVSEWACSVLFSAATNCWNGMTLIEWIMIETKNWNQT